MDALESLLQAAKAGKFKSNRPNIATFPIERPAKPLTAVSPATSTELPPGLSAALNALTAAERALCSPAIVAALVAELPTRTDWATWPLPARRDWITERLGLSPTRFWHITRNGRRWFVEFAEPQTATTLLEQAARNRPGETLTLTPARLLPALRDNVISPVDNSEKPSEVNKLQQAPLLPDNGILSNNLTTSGPEVLTVSAAELLQGAGVAVRYVADPTTAEPALAELAALPDTGPWGLDIETMPLPAFRTDRKAGLDPWRSAIRLVQIYPGGATCYVFDVAALGLSPFMGLLQTRAFVAHNALFELKFLLHHGAAPGKLGCTLLQDNALGNGRRSLAALSAERLNWALDKALQVFEWTAANLTPAQLDYAALDAVAAYRLAGLQAALLKERGLVRCYSLMRDAQPAIARLELAGCPFDTAAHSALVAQWQATAEQARGELDSLLNGANPDSPAQLAKWLETNLPADSLATWPKTATGQRATDADTLAGLSLPALEPLKRYKLAVKGLSTYGKGYAAHISPVTGRIHASFIPGTAAGRLSCQSPNIQNPPRDTAFRALFAPGPGRCLVVADYGQIELRVAALVSGDSAMLAAYEQGQDLHRKTAAAVLGIEPEAVTKAQRQMAKAVNFGLLFGQGAKGLQAYAKASYGVDMTLPEAERAKTAFLEAYKGLSRWQRQQQEQARFAKQVRTPGGRVRGLDGDRQLATASLNTPIQGGAAECLLAALAELSLPNGAALVNVVHDELVVECGPEQAEPVAAEVERAMVAGFKAIFPEGCTRDLVEAHTGPNWAAAKG